MQEVIDVLKLMETTKERPEPAADTQAGALSGGEKKRVNIALELLTKPSVLFLDELHLQPGRGAQGGGRGEHEGPDQGRPDGHHGHP